MYEKYPELKVQPDGYMKSFTTEEREEYKAFFDKYGFVVIRDVVSAEECNICIDEVRIFYKLKGLRTPSWP